ncbi:MAG TPA: molybdopterin-dependent oxidoreductase [Dehalococcoidia bacterium]|nr:molybdopterin-dependent oxidoreductase [Dehalococcoidia bacterium]
MRKKVIVAAIAFFAALSVVLLAINSCTTNVVEVLESQEIREYQGEDLSSVNDFRENSIRGPQYVDIEDYGLEITGLVECPQSYTYDEVIRDHQSYKKVVTLNCVEGWDATILWEGFLVRDLLAEVKPTDDARTVIFHAYDGYTTSFPIEYVANNDIIMAYKMNDVPLPPERGFPFQLVAESKWGYKWIKWITKIELSDDVNYRGFWESRGYSNSGDLDKSFFD